MTSATGVFTPRTIDLTAAWFKLAPRLQQHAAIVRERIPTITELRSSVTPDLRRKGISFVAVGAASTALYFGLYLVLRSTLAADWSNIVASLVSTLFSTAANRRYTLQMLDREHAVAQHLQMIALFGFGLGVNAVALLALFTVSPDAGSIAELAVLSVSGLVVTALRVLAMRRWSQQAVIERLEAQVVLPAPVIAR